MQFYELFYRNGIWFTSAYDHLSKAWGTFRCDYMEEMTELTAEVYPIKRREELVELQDNYEANYHNTPFKVSVTQAGREHYLRNHYPNMELVQEEGQYYIVGGYHQDELEYMVQYLVGLGNRVYVLKPEELRNSYLKRLKEIISQYE